MRPAALELPADHPLHRYTSAALDRWADTLSGLIGDPTTARFVLSAVEGALTWDRCTGGTRNLEAVAARLPTVLDA